MKIKIHVTNVSLTPSEFNSFCFFLQLRFPCELVEDGVIIEDTIPAGPVFAPECDPPIPAPDVRYRQQIKECCERVLSFFGDGNNVEKTYNLRIETED